MAGSFSGGSLGKTIPVLVGDTGVVLTTRHASRVPPTSDFGARQVDAVKPREAESLLRG